MRRTIDIELAYQPLIASIPEKYGDPYKQACTGDEVTIASWRDIWTANYAKTKERFGEFASRSFGQLYGINRHKPAIVLGSGPSLKESIPELQKNQMSPNPVMTVSCLHNFSYLEDHGVKADYYLSLDSGGIIMQDFIDGSTKDEAYYWEQTKDRVLLAAAASPPELFDKWQGKVYLFNTLLPDMDIRKKFDEIERFSHYISSGGNALGACMYSAKAVMGSCEIIFVGADFAFSLDNQFHPFKSQYDSFGGKGPGNTVRWVDVFGLPRQTWPSYLNFKCWFDWVSLNIPGTWSSASEGIMGAYPEGNLGSFKYGSLENLLEKYRIADVIRLGEMTVVNGQPAKVVDEKGVQKSRPHMLSELFKDSKQPMDLTLF